MGGFSVDTDALYGYSKLLDRYGGASGSVWEFILHQSEEGDGYGASATNIEVVDIMFNTITERGIFAFLIGKHLDYCKDARDRIGCAGEGAEESYRNLSEAADYYKKSEHDSSVNLAKIDATLPEKTSFEQVARPHFPDSVKDYTESDSNSDVYYHSTRHFHDIDPPEHFLKAPDADTVDALEPKAGEIQTWIDDIANWLSPTSWIRILIKKICEWASAAGLPSVKTDPITAVIEFFTGDWRSWAYYTAVWKSCEHAVDAMQSNVEFGAKELGHHWHGNSADAALAYFVEFAKATGGESNYFEYLFETYRSYLDIVYDFYSDISNLVNALVDLLVPVSDIFKIPKVAKQAWDIIMQILDLLSRGGDAITHQTSADTGAVENIYALATRDEPPQEMKKFLQKTLGGYHFPQS